jgi:hypothetical protein
MDYFQGVVGDYLAADPAMFVNPEFCIRLSDRGSVKSTKHWYSDIMAINLRHPAVYLCEVSYSRTLNPLLTRLKEWNADWPAVQSALQRDSHVDPDWPLRVWLFVLDDSQALLADKLPQALGTADGLQAMPTPLLTTLESVPPWKYPKFHVVPGEHESDAF